MRDVLSNLILSNVYMCDTLRLNCPQKDSIRKNEQERLGGLGPQDASAIGSALGYIAQRQPAWNTSQPTEAPSTQLEKFNEGETLIGEDGEKKEEVER